jgi:GH24 family phage-related lysozyme (muramidase)
MVVDLAQATRLLQADLFKFRAATETLLGNHSATDNEFAAMVSLCYNVGADNFRTSSVLREHCAGRRINAADAFRLWNKARVNGVLTVLAGLTSRREAERSLYLTRNTGT